MISLCVATRKRPGHFKRLCETALKFADHPDQIEFVSFHDDDDRTVYEYVGNHKEIVGSRSLDIFKMANECAKVAAGDIYMYTADDFYFETEHWDTYVLQEFEKYPDKILLVVPDGESWKRWAWSGCGWVHRKWIDTVGYLLPPYDGGQAADKWLDGMARAIGRFVKLDTVRVQHTNVKDKIHHKKNARCREGRWTNKYNRPENVKIRTGDTEKLRLAMNAQ